VLVDLKVFWNMPVDRGTDAKRDEHIAVQTTIGSTMMAEIFERAHYLTQEQPSLEKQKFVYVIFELQVPEPHAKLSKLAALYSRIYTQK
jgi:hypothetical protein